MFFGTFQAPSEFTARVSACLIKPARVIDKLLAIWSIFSSRSGGKASEMAVCFPIIFRGTAGASAVVAGVASGAPPMNTARAASLVLGPVLRAGLGDV
jgi:hypothetical protein